MAASNSNLANVNYENVISLANVQARRRNVTAESVSVINDCRDIALKRIAEILSKSFDTIEDELFDMAQASADSDTQSLYLDARSQAREKRGAIELSFRNQFLSFFAQKVSAPIEEAKPSTDDFDYNNMSLVEDCDLEEKIALEAISRRLSSNCERELRALSQRMGFLMSEPELNDDANPMSPDTIIKALQVACEQMTSGYKTKLTIMRMVEQHMTKEMMGVYRDINSHLVARQIMPKIRPTFRKPQNNNQPKADNPKKDVANSSDAAAENFRAATVNLANPGQDLFAAFQQLMSGSILARTGEASSALTAHMGGGQPGHAVSNTAGIVAPNLPNADLISALTQIQQQVLANNTQFTTIANIQNFVPGETPIAALNILHAVKERGLGLFGQPGNQIDAMTIDIVALLFEYIFEDEAIPDSIKALLARLQIPVLKVAILDKSFFSKKAHPVRRLLDSLAKASICFAGAATHDDPLYQKIETLIENIRAEFETDIGIFSEAMVEFELFLGAREAASSELIEQSARALHAREKREMARLIALDEIERRVTANELPAAVVAMLRGPWTRVLERVYLRDGGRNQYFIEKLEAADDLAWSVAPKMDSQGRKRLVLMLPSLLRRLQEGLEIAAVEQRDRERFFSALVDCHAAAVKAGLRGESVTALMASTQPPAEAAPLFEKLINEERAREAARNKTTLSGIARIQFTENGIEFGEVLTPLAGDASTAMSTGAAVGDASTEENLINNAVDFDITGARTVELTRGTWIEFIHGKGIKLRAKLTWISPLKGMYLFTSPGANEALSVAPDALQAQLRCGTARIIEESSLIDRAVNRIFNSLSAPNPTTHYG